MRKQVTVTRDVVTHLITGLTSEEEAPGWAAQLQQVLAQMLEREPKAPPRDMLPPIPEPESLAKRLAKEIGPGKSGQVLGWTKRHGQKVAVWEWPAGHAMRKQQPTPGRYHGTDPVVAGVIQQVLARVPADVRDFVAKHCDFLPVGAGGTAVSPTRIPAGHWNLVLHAPTIKTAEGPAVVAHEVAHAWLGHTTKSVDGERAAATLVASWGFTGQAADPDHCAR